jgi:uncharacterized protein (TIGR02678 family)
LVVTPEAARLRKFTTLTTDTTRLALEPRNGEPFTRTRYTLLCLALSTLERGDRQITLRRLSEYLLTAATLETRLHALTDPARPDTPEARNRAHRTTLIARLLDDPVLYYDTLADDEKTYLDYQRSSILDTLAEATALHLEVRAEGIALADLEGDCTDAGLPEEGTEGHLTLLVATWLADRLRAGDATPLSLESIQAKIANLIRRHTHHWRK